GSYTSATRDETSRNISSTTSTESPEVVRQLELMNKNFVEMMRQIQSVKSVNLKCETCGGPHSFIECPAADGYTQEAVYATTVVEDMDPYLDEGMGDVIVGEPFCKASCVEARRFYGIIIILDGDDSTGPYSDTFYRFQYGASWFWDTAYRLPV
ncbi:hypothetical protein Tco_0116258, partial [Tanacetum coccineum]